jgi:hypothetical protein
LSKAEVRSQEEEEEEEEPTALKLCCKLFGKLYTAAQTYDGDRDSNAVEVKVKHRRVQPASTHLGLRIEALGHKAR